MPLSLSLVTPRQLTQLWSDVGHHVCVNCILISPIFIRLQTPHRNASSLFCCPRDASRWSMFFNCRRLGWLQCYENENLLRKTFNCLFDDECRRSNERNWINVLAISAFSVRFLSFPFQHRKCLIKYLNFVFFSLIHSFSFSLFSQKSHKVTKRKTSKKNLEEAENEEKVKTKINKAGDSGTEKSFHFKDDWRW